MSIPSKKFDARYYSTGSYDDYTQHIFSWIPEIGQKIQSLLKNNDSVSIGDIGCAQGFLIDYLAKTYGYHVLGLEYSSYARQKAPRTVKRFIRQGSILNKKTFLKEEFDLVVCLDVVNYLTSREANIAIQNLVFWSKKYIFFSALYKHSSHASQKRNPDPYRLTMLTQKEYQHLFKVHGARFVRKFYSENGGDVLIFEKIK